MIFAMNPLPFLLMCRANSIVGLFRGAHGSAVLLKSMGRRTKCFQRSNGGGTSGFNPEFFEYFLDVFFDGGFGDAEDGRDVGVGLALSEPR